MLPLLLMAAGTGAQMYGANQRSSALDAANAAQGMYTNMFNGIQDASDQNMIAAQRSLRDYQTGSENQLVSAFGAPQRLAAYGQGADQNQAMLSQVLAGLPQMAPAANGNGALNMALAREHGRVLARTQPLMDQAAINGGLSGLRQYEGQAGAAYSARSLQAQRAAEALMRVNGLGQALRQRALSRLNDQHSLELQQAQQAGNSAMLAGGLLNVAGQGLAAYNGTQSAPQEQYIDTRRWQAPSDSYSLVQP